MLLLLLACDPADVTHKDVSDMDEFFPTDGARRSEYVSHDPAVDWLLVVEKVDAAAISGGTTFEWRREDTGDLLGSVSWNANGGIEITGAAEASALTEVFNPAIAVATTSMNVGDVLTTEVGGRTYTSTFVANETCEIAWGTTVEDCLHFTVDDGDADPMSGPIFAGDLWLALEFGPVWMHTTGYTDKWDLSDFDWSGS